MGVRVIELTEWIVPPRQPTIGDCDQHKQNCPHGNRCQGEHEPQFSYGIGAHRDGHCNRAGRGMQGAAEDSGRDGKPNGQGDTQHGVRHRQTDSDGDDGGHGVANNG